MFKERLGLIIDKPKPGFGLSNDGNTARRFFKDPHITAAITGLEPFVIEKFSNILAAISSNQIINPNIFQKYTAETAKLFLETYPNFTFSPTIHKILYHGHEYIKEFPFIPLGIFYHSYFEIS